MGKTSTCELCGGPGSESDDEFVVRVYSYGLGSNLFKLDQLSYTSGKCCAECAATIGVGYTTIPEKGIESFMEPEVKGSHYRVHQDIARRNSELRSEAYAMRRNTMARDLIKRSKSAKIKWLHAYTGVFGVVCLRRLYWDVTLQKPRASK